MKARLLAGILVLSNLSLSGSATHVPALGATPNPVPTPDFGPMKNVGIFDPVFNMVAYTISIPANWKFEGTVLHSPGCKLETIVPVYRAYSPDMRFGVQLAPRTTWFWADAESGRPKGPDCKALPPMSAADYGALVTIRMRPGSVIDKVEQPPSDKMAELVAKNNAATSGNPNAPKQIWDAKRLFIHYDFNGQPEEELVSIGMMVTDSPVTFIVNKPGGQMGNGIEHLYTTNANFVGMRAPKGQLQLRLAELQAIAFSSKENPDYQAKLTAYLANQTQHILAANRQVFNSFMKMNAQQAEQQRQNAQSFIRNMQQQAANRTAEFKQSMDQRSANAAQFNANMDRRSGHAQDVCDYLLDQQLFVDPTTGEKSKASNQYDHTFRDGSINSNTTTTLQTDSPTYNPQGILKGNWVELQPIHN